jgi:hypothetical protein
VLTIAHVKRRRYKPARSAEATRLRSFGSRTIFPSTVIAINQPRYHQSVSSLWQTGVHQLESGYIPGATGFPSSAGPDAKATDSDPGAASRAFHWYDTFEPSRCG